MADMCEKCGKRPAAYVYTRRIGGEEEKTLLCAACAAAMGIVGFGAGGIGNFLFGDFGKQFTGFASPRSDRPVKKCDLCGTAFDEILQNGKVGCPRCYRTFAAELAPRIAELHGGALYKGEGPSGADKADAGIADAGVTDTATRGETQRLRSLQEALTAAVKAENYEKAAELRDEIKALQKEGKENGMV